MSRPKRLRLIAPAVPLVPSAGNDRERKGKGSRKRKHSPMDNLHGVPSRTPTRQRSISEFYHCTKPAQRILPFNKLIAPPARADGKNRAPTGGGDGDRDKERGESGQVFAVIKVDEMPRNQSVYTAPDLEEIGIFSSLADARQELKTYVRHHALVRDVKRAGWCEEGGEDGAQSLFKITALACEKEPASERAYVVVHASCGRRDLETGESLKLPGLAFVGGNRIFNTKHDAQEALEQHLRNNPQYERPDKRRGHCWRSWNERRGYANEEATHTFKVVGCDRDAKFWRTFFDEEGVDPVENVSDAESGNEEIAGSEEPSCDSEDEDNECERGGLGGEASAGGRHPLQHHHQGRPLSLS